MKIWFCASNWLIELIFVWLASPVGLLHTNFSFKKLYVRPFFDPSVFVYYRNWSWCLKVFHSFSLKRGLSTHFRDLRILFSLNSSLVTTRLLIALVTPSHPVILCILFCVSGQHVAFGHASQPPRCVAGQWKSSLDRWWWQLLFVWHSLQCWTEPHYVWCGENNEGQLTWRIIQNTEGVLMVG